MKKKYIITFIALVISIATVLLAGSMTKAEASSMWQTKNLYETRNFNILGKGDAFSYSEKQQRTTWSLYEPTGIYVKAGEEITITSSGNYNVYAYVQSFGKYKTGTNPGDSWDQAGFLLSNGTNKIKPTKDGILYLSNSNIGSSVNISVTGGTHFPIFVKGHTTDTQFKQMLAKYPNAPFVEFVSERGFITVPMSYAKTYYAMTNATQPSTLVKNLDIILEAQDKLAGFDDDGGFHQQDYHYRHMMTDENSDWYMYSTEHRTAYVKSNINHVLQGMTTEGWGPWHENGHQIQNNEMDFHNMTEVNVNNYSLAAEKALGLSPQLTRSNTWPKIMSYLNQSQSQKNFHGDVDYFIKLGLYQQLNLSFGDQFMQNLNRAYRETPASQIPVTAKDQKFIYMTSKVSGYNLIPYFEKWGLPIDQATKTAITNLKLQTLTKNIWENTDSSYHVMPNIKLSSDRVSVTMSKEFYKDRVVLVYKNGNYLFEAYNGATINGVVDSSNAYTTTIYSDVKLNENDLIEVRFATGKLGQITGSPSNVKASERYVAANAYVAKPNVNLKLDTTGFTATVPTSDFNSKNRIVLYVNGVNVGETYNGTKSSSLTSSISGNTTILKGKYNTTDKSIRVDAYLVPGTLGSTINLASSTWLTSAGTSFGAYENPKADLVLTDKGFSATISEEFFKSKSRIMFFINGQYIAETYAGTAYSISSTTDGTTRTLYYNSTSINKDTKIEVYLVSGKPGYGYEKDTSLLLDALPKKEVPVTPPTVNLTLNSTGFTATLPTTDYRATNRIVYYVNGAYFGETYNGSASSVFTTTTSGTSTVLTGKYNTTATNIKVDAYLVPGTLGSTIDLSKSTLLKTASGSFGQATPPTVNLTLNSTGFTATLPTTDYRATNRIVYYVNGAYYGETYSGSASSVFTTTTSGTSTVLTGKYNTTATNIKVDAYLVPGTLGSTIDLSKSTLLKTASGSFGQATPPTVNLTLNSTGFTATLPTTDYRATNRIVYYVNGAYYGETYNGAASSVFTNTTSGTSTVLTGKYNTTATSIKVDAYLVPGTLGSAIDLSKSTLLKTASANFGQTTLPTVGLTLSPTGFKATLADSVFKSQQRIIFHVNGKYVGETYNGATYYVSQTLSGSTRTITGDYNTSSKDIKVDVYLVAGKPGDSYDLSKSSLLKTASANYNVSSVNIIPTATGFSATMDDSMFKSTKRIVFVINGVYAGETYNGNSYYMNSTLSGTTRNLSVTNKSVAKGAKVEAYQVSGTPGASYNLSTSTLLKSVIY